jgi:hypothetical protein
MICILFSAFVGLCTEYKKIPSIITIKLPSSQSLSVVRVVLPTFCLSVCLSYANCFVITSQL